MVQVLSLIEFLIVMLAVWLAEQPGAHPQGIPRP